MSTTSDKENITSRRTYHFIEVKRCNMCGSESDGHRILGKRLNRSQGTTPQKKSGITVTIMQCSRCDLIYANPLPVPQNIQDHYGVPPESYWVPEYFKVSDNLFEWEHSVLVKLGLYKPGQRALDIGTGVGKGMVAMKKFGYDTYGLEPSETFYRKAVDTLKVDKDKLTLQSVEDAQYPDDHFDFISFWAVLEHVQDPNMCLKRAMRWLKPGGAIHVEVPSSNWLMSKLLNGYYKLRGKDYVTNLSPMHVPYHLYEFGLKSFVENGRQNGYEVIYHYVNPCKTYTNKLLDKPLRKIMKATDTGMQLIVFLRKTENRA